MEPEYELWLCEECKEFYKSTDWQCPICHPPKKQTIDWKSLEQVFLEMELNK